MSDFLGSIPRLVVVALALSACASDEVGTTDTRADATDTSVSDADTRTDATDATDTTLPDAPTETSQVDSSPSDASDVSDDTDASPPTIGWCILQYPKSLTLAPGATSPTIYGRVFVAGVTETSIPGGDGYPILAELGLGQGEGAATWTWAPASYVRDVGNDDELEATFAAPQAEGEYRYAYRVRLIGAASSDWTYCDGDGLDDGFAVEDAGALTVAEPPADEVDYAILRPATASWTAGAQPATIEVVVFEDGVTQGAGPGAGIGVQIGYGDIDSGFTWLDASYARDEDGLGALDNDVYAAVLPADLPVGTWDVIANVTLDGGVTRTFVDTSGTLDGYDQALAAKVTVNEFTLVDYCRIQYPTDPITLSTGGSADVYGVAYHPAITGISGTHALVSAAGFGPTGSTPSASWTWVAGTFNGTFDNGFGQQTNDEHKAVLSPPTSGNFDWAWRFSLDAGAHWTYCDKAGSEVYDPAQAGKLVVQP